MTTVSVNRNPFPRGRNKPAFLGSMTAAVLAGGTGSRLRPVIHDRSKVMAPVFGVPFLTYLLEQISQYGIKKTVLCTGVFADSIASYFGSRYQDMAIEYSYEPAARGTAGALRGALELFDNYPVLVMNGDSFCDVDLAQFIHWHFQKGGTVSLTVARVEEGERFGAVKFDSNYRLTEFCEKGQTTGPVWVNAGMYLMERAVIESISREEASSLETDIFPKVLDQGVYGYPIEGRFLDIGTPASYLRAEDYFCNTHQNLKT